MNDERITAVRTRKGDKATVLVTLPDGTTQSLGGARAGRAAAVLVEDRPRQHRGRTVRWQLSCRADLTAAEREAHRLSTRTTMRSAYSYEPVPTTPVPTVAVPVTEADAEAAAAAPEVVSAGALQAGDVIRMRPGGVLCTWEDQQREGVSWDDLEKVPTGVDLTVESVEPIALVGYRSPYGRRSRVYMVTVGGRPFKVSSAQKLLRMPAPAEPAPVVEPAPPGAEVVGEEYAADYDRGVAAAQRHAQASSFASPGRTRLHSWTYARRMSDTCASDGVPRDASYWAGYTAEAHRIEATGVLPAADI